VVLYLKGTRNYGIRFTKDLEESEPSKGRMVAWSDADHCADKHNRKSILGGVGMFNGGPVWWFSKQAKHNTRSTMESELSALDSTAREVLYMRKLGTELGVEGAEKIDIMEDNAACKNFANGSKLTGLTKHIDVKYHSVRSDVQDGRVQVKTVATDENRADLFTKWLSAKDFVKFRKDIGIVEVPQFR
jgi:hypothetical protein